MPPHFDGFVFLHQILKIHIYFSSSWINMIPLLFESSQLIISLKNIGNNNHIGLFQQALNVFVLKSLFLDIVVSLL